MVKKKRLKLILFSFTIIILILVKIFRNPYSVELHQTDDLFPYKYPLLDTYIQEIQNRDELVSLFFYNYGGKNSFIDFDVKSIRRYKTITICSVNFFYDNKVKQLSINETYEFKNGLLADIPDIYHEIYHSKKKIKLRPIFKEHLKKNDKFPVDIEIVYTIDNGDIKKTKYNFEANSFLMMHILMLK